MHSVAQRVFISKNFANHASRKKNAAESFEKKNNVLTAPCEETIVETEV